MVKKTFKAFAFDAKKPKSKMAPSQAAEANFRKALKKIANASSHIVERHVDGANIVDEAGMVKALQEYSRVLTPWAKKQAKKLYDDTLKRINSDKAYREQSKRISKLLSDEMFEREIEVKTKEMFLEQVGLIQSIPIEAGERAQGLALEAVAGGRRAEEVALELSKTKGVTESRAILIARTETARTNTVLNKARAESVGSTQYVWRTSQDASVRHSHKIMNGKVFDWDDPPTLEDGMTGHPGTFPNCRCYPEAILPEE